ncbi:MAG: RluA family pseudouridine synthase [Anaerolineae bacterium]|nr:RluA family pseudouridine synthase [Anaerolineae bacterium]
METFVVTPDRQGERLDKFMIAQRPDLSRAFVQSLIVEGSIKVNRAARKANYAVKPGDTITLEIPAPAPSAIQIQEIPLDILYEDDALLALNKPADMVVHPAVGHPTGTLVNAVLGHDPNIVTSNQERAGIVHRLDRDTSGVILVAKTDLAMRELQRQFAAREIHKTYLALVTGIVKTPQGKIDAPLGRDPHDRKKMAIVSGPNAREAVTIFSVLAHSDRYTLVQVEPETGRTHQIRVHLAFLKHPVVGDELYNRKKDDLGIGRQFLHAWRITFRHPITGEPMTCTAPLAPDLIEALERAQISPDAFERRDVSRSV